MVAIDIDHIVLAHRASRHGQETGGHDLTGMRDEQEAVAIVDALLGTVQSIGILEAGPLEGDLRPGAGFGLFALDGDPPVHRRGGGFDIERRLLGQVVQPVEDPFVLFGADHPRHLGAPGGHQEEHRPLHGANFLDERHHLRQVIDVMARDGRIDLGADAHLLGVAQDVHGALPRAFHLAEVIVDCGARRVQAEGDAPDACLGGLLQAFDGRQGGRRGGQRAAQALLRGIGDQFEQVAAHHRVAAGEDQDRAAEIGQPVDQAQPFLGVQFIGIALVLGVGAAVHAGISARTRHLPGNRKRRLAEIRLQHAVVVVLAFGCGLGG